MSIAMPEGESQPASGQVAVTLSATASNRTISFLSSILAKTVPVPSTAGNSGLPGSGIVATDGSLNCIDDSYILTTAVEGPYRLCVGLEDKAIRVCASGDCCHLLERGTVKDDDGIGAAIGDVAKPCRRYRR